MRTIKQMVEPTISLVMIVKNEEKVLRRCLESAAKFLDEIVIVDTGSTDRTIDIALEYDAKIYHFDWVDDFSAARNFALSQVNSFWSLVLDADEYISNDCAEAISSFIKGDPAIGRVKRIDQFTGSDGINYEQIYISRIFPSNCRYVGAIHEQVEADLPRRIVDIEIFHDGYDQKIKSDRNIPILQKAVQEFPNDPYYHFQIAKEFRGVENHDLAYEHLLKSYNLLSYKESYAPSVVIQLLYAMIGSGMLEHGIAIIEAEEEFLASYPDFYFVSALYLLELTIIDLSSYGHLIPLIEKFYIRALELGETQLEGSVRGTGSYAALHNLGVFYEVTGRIDEAIDNYRQAIQLGYQPSKMRLEQLELGRTGNF